jgi:hypothetical protein
MRMRIKRANVKRLASLSALGAGALGVAAGTAEAGIIYTPLPPGTIVGPNGSSSWGITLPGYSNYFTFLRRTLGTSASGGYSVGVKGTGVQFRLLGSFLSIVGAGQKWGPGGGATVGSTPFPIASRSFKKSWHPFPGTWSSGTYVPPWTTTSGSGGGYWTNGTYINSGTVTTTQSWARGNGNFSHQYALFHFQDSGNDRYGWIQLSNAVFAGPPGLGPNVTLEGWAYDDSGSQIGAGDIPEPSTMALAGLGALALGATGLRRWRAARKA